MQKIIRCTGRLAENPYKVPGTARRLYSIEEICYYVYNNIYSIDIGFFSPDLLAFIENDLDLPETAKAMRDLLANGHGVRDMVAALMLSCDLYGRKETEELLKLMVRLSGYSGWERRAHIGYKYLRDGSYVQALKHFRGILKEENLSENDYGQVLLATGIALVHTAGYREAADCFYKSYRACHEKKALIYTILCFKLGGLGKEFEEKIGEMPKDDPTVMEAEKLWDEAREKALNSKTYTGLLEILEGLSGVNATGVRLKLNTILGDLKDQYRKGVENGLVS